MLAVTLLTSLVMSCMRSENVLYSHFEQIGAEGWDPLDMLVFEPQPTDTSAATTYRMDIVVRHSSRFDIRNIPLAVMIENSEGVVRSDTIVISPDGDGRTEAKERYGVREIRLTLDSALRLSDGYAVTLSPIVERERTKGLLNVGLILTDSRAPRRSTMVGF